MGLNLTFHDKRIAGVLTVLPRREVTFEEGLDAYNFPPAKSMKLKLAMGYDRRRIVEEGTNVSDLCVFGLKYLFDNELLQREDVSALLLVTQSPEHFMPPTSNIIHGLLELPQNVLCMDINQGCAGFILGLVQAYMLLEQPEVRKVVLMNADVLSRKVSPRDRNSNPLIGDAACITVVERSAEPTSIHAVVNTDGRGAYTLQIPAGGFKQPCTAETAMMHEDVHGNFRSAENLVMKGDEVFNFVQTAVPPMISDLLDRAGLTADDIDRFLFHQPNRFMLNKLADKIGAPREKMPSNIVERFGNASGASIPTNISYNLGDEALSRDFRVCFAGFGVGLTWAAIVQKIGKLKFNKILEFG